MTQAALWLGLPVVMFVLCWFRPWVSVPLFVLLALGVWRVFGAGSDFRAPGYADIAVGGKYYAILAVAFLYVLVSGIGGFVAQMPNDHAWRNAVFFDLARNSWPVSYPDGGYLCYYFLFWLPSALVSKATGSIMAGDAAQVLWAVWGTWIALCFIVSQTGGKARWTVILVFIFFNAWDALASALFTDEYYNIFENPLAPQLMWLSTTSARFADSANPIIYNFIYNQGIAVWVFLGVLLHERRHPERLLFWLSLTVGFAPIPSLAFVPYVAWKLLSAPRRAVSLPNIAGFFVALAVSAFLLSNNSGGRFRMLSAYGSPWILLLLSACYALLSYGAYIPFIWSYVRRSALFWSLLLMAVAVPVFGIGTTPDLAWRISVPFVMLLCTCVCRKATKLRGVRTSVALMFVCVLAVGSFSSFYTFFRTGVNELEVARGERDRKYIFMLSYISDPGYNVYYNNFVASGDSFYRRFMMPGGDESATSQAAPAQQPR